MTPPESSSRQQHNAWLSLRSVTTARIALGTSGVSIPLKESLAFRLAHAHARDAVYSTLDVAALVIELRLLGLPVLELASRVCDRQEYLRRPDA
ncbi:MAG: ethanolamine ammonia-lyase subunit EutC, partial [Bacteroidia bacterium]|nr:ethanolamine ammonia-lyase subunit EutC [Bacteroidia bacterium]